MKSPILLANSQDLLLNAHVGYYGMHLLYHKSVDFASRHRLIIIVQL